MKRRSRQHKANLTHWLMRWLRANGIDPDDVTGWCVDLAEDNCCRYAVQAVTDSKVLTLGKFPSLRDAMYVMAQMRDAAEAR